MHIILRDTVSIPSQEQFYGQLLHRQHWESGNQGIETDLTLLMANHITLSRVYVLFLLYLQVSGIGRS